MLTEDDSKRKSFQDYWLTSYIWHPLDMKIMWITPGLIEEAPRSWEPIVNLISGLHNLREINYIARNRFSPSLQQAMSKYHPYCRLNILAAQDVYSSTLVEVQENRPPGILSLAGLQSLAMHFDYGAQVEMLDAMISTVFAIPGLKELKIQSRWNGSSDEFSDFSASWQAPIIAFPTKQASNVESLALQEIDSIAPDRTGLLAEKLIMKLATAGYTSGLRTLDLGRFYNAKNLARIAELFPNIERLFINPNQTLAASEADDEDTIAGICAFKPLRWLCLHELRDVKSLHRITERHGQSLKCLIVAPSGLYESEYPKLSTSDILQLAANCPNLENLRIQITRSMGNHDECEKYKALGTLAKLHSLVLDLNIDLHPRLRSPMAAGYNDVRFVQEVFMNAAIDEQLALEIWNLIKTNKSCRLQYLRIVPFGEFLINRPGITSGLVSRFARSFLVSRYNFYDPDCPSIEEIGKGVQLMLQKKLVRRYWPTGLRHENCCLSQTFVEALRGIWPHWPQGDSMWSGWTSFPLQVDGE